MIVIIISATSEWRQVRPLFPAAQIWNSPYGEWFVLDGESVPLVIFNGGWGKIASAASAQYAIDRWKPHLLLNMGTCGGLGGRVAPGDIILVRRTLVYDMSVEIGDPDEELSYYTSEIELPEGSLRGLPFPVVEGTIISGDRDVPRMDVPLLIERYGALAADWESASIAFVARRNAIRCVILRGVSDVVGGGHIDAYEGREHLFHAGAATVMQRLFGALSDITAAFKSR